MRQRNFATPGRIPKPHERPQRRGAHFLEDRAQKAPGGAIRGEPGHLSTDHRKRPQEGRTEPRRGHSRAPKRRPRQQDTEPGAYFLEGQEVRAGSDPGEQSPDRSGSDPGELTPGERPGGSGTT